MVDAGINDGAILVNGSVTRLRSTAQSSLRWIDGEFTVKICRPSETDVDALQPRLQADTC